MPLRQPCLVLILFLTCCGLAAGGPTQRRPNLVVFLVDDLGWQDVSVPFGPEETPFNRRYRTPNLERLAAEGLKLTSGYAAAPVCTPTRTSLMTGSSPARSHITFWTLNANEDTSKAHPSLRAPDWRMGGLQPGDVTLAGLLQAGGYRTIHAGKAHLGANGTGGADPRSLGFDVNIAGHAAGGPGSYLGTHAFRANARSGKPGTSVWDVPGLEDYHHQDVFLTEALAIEACAAVRESVAAEQPFFLHFAPYAVHAPLMANRKYLGNYPGIDEREQRYATMIESVDQALGALLATLEEQGVADSTLIVFTSDNGGLSAHARGGEPHVHNAPLRSGKGSAYEGGVRVPWVVRWPGVVAAGTSSDEPVVTSDLFPTLLAAAGLPLPADHAEVVDGINVLPLLRGQQLEREHPLVWHQPHMWGAKGPGIEPFSAMRMGSQKLILFHAQSRVELYDLGSDLGEERDLAGVDPVRTAELAAVLGDELRRRGAQPSIVQRTGAAQAFPARAKAARAGDITAPGERAPKGVVVIFIDDMAYGDLSCFGGPTGATPRMDRMATEGMLSTDFYVSQPVCSASRASLLTGCYSNRIGIHGALGPGSKVGIGAGELTLAELCRSKGFGTAIFGKWHLGDAAEFLPTNHGFDEYYGIPYSNDMWPLHPESPNAWPPLPTFEGQLVVDINGDQRRHTRDFTERAVRFLERSAEAERPFFLYLPHPQPHVPLFVAEGAEGKSGRGLFGDVIAELDRSVGEVLDALERLGLEDDTLVMLTSDNGPWLSYGDHAGSTAGLREGKGTTFDGGVRVPCILRWPGVIPAGGVCREPWSTIDVLPTLAGLLGADLPDHPIDGKDAFELWTRDQPKSRDDCEPDANGPRGADEPLLFFYNRAELQALRLGRWKLHVPHGYRTMEGRELGTGGIPGKYDYSARIDHALFDLWDDPFEQHDVAADHPELMARLKAMAQAGRDELGIVKDGPTGTGIRPAGSID